MQHYKPHEACYSTVNLWRVTCGIVVHKRRVKCSIVNLTRLIAYRIVCEPLEAYCIRYCEPRGESISSTNLPKRSDGIVNPPEMYSFSIVNPLKCIYTVL